VLSGRASEAGKPEVAPELEDFSHNAKYDLNQMLVGAVKKPLLFAFDREHESFCLGASSDVATNFVF